MVSEVKDDESEMFVVKDHGWVLIENKWPRLNGSVNLKLQQL